MADLRKVDYLRRKVVDLQLSIKMMRFIKSLGRYDPNQPRAPKGGPEGGQWILVAGNSGLQAGGKWNNANYEKCEEQMLSDEKLGGGRIRLGGR